MLRTASAFCGSRRGGEPKSATGLVSRAPSMSAKQLKADVRAIGLQRRGCVESRCGAVAVGRTYPFSAPFVRRCLTGSPVAPFPHPAHRTGHVALVYDTQYARAYCSNSGFKEIGRLG